MKKILVIFLCLINSTFAFDYGSYCSTKKPDSSFLGGLMSASGTNFISRNIIEHEISKYLKKETNSDFKVKITTFLGVNIFSGEFKSFSAKALQYANKGLYLSDVKVDTLCEYNKITYTDNKPVFDYDIPLKFSAILTEENLENTIKSNNAYHKFFDSINNDDLSRNLVKIEPYAIKIVQNKILLKYKITPFKFLGLIKPFDVAFSAKLRIKDNKIELCDVEFLSSKAKKSNYMYLVDLLNPKGFKIEIKKNNFADMEIENISISNSKIYLEGHALIARSE